MIRTFYEERLKQSQSLVNALKRRNPFFLASELLFFILFVLLLYVYFSEIKAILVISLSLLCVVLYAVAACLDRINGRNIAKARRMITVTENELHYLDGDFAPFDDGAEYVDASHPYSSDMDLFGAGSLYQRVNRTVTTDGSDRLARMLTQLPAKAAMVHSRQESIEELSRTTDERLMFMAAVDKKIDTHRTKMLLDEAAKVKFGALFSHAMMPVLIRIAAAVLLLTILLAVFTSLSSNVPVMLSVLMLMTSLMISSRPLNKIGRIVNKMSRDFSSYSPLLATLSQCRFNTPMNTALYRQLFVDNANSANAFRELEKLLKSIDRRGNILGLVFANALFCNDIMLVCRFIAWQKKYLHLLPRWIEALGTMDAMMSLATLRFNTPEGCVPEVVESDPVIYDVKELWHPFIPEPKVVKNSFTVTDGAFYIITGANMAGKSTFLRSVGINYILAMTGTVVFASSMRVSVFNLFTGMCTTDDLNHGISYFNAELLRLKQLIDSCKQATRTLIILDEILKGTNSLDKLNGSRMFLQYVSALPVTGIIATHDLELSKMHDEDPHHFVNYCFEVELSDTVTYSYRITPGVARNQNATFLLKNILKP